MLRSWIVSLLILTAIGAATFYVRASTFAPPAAAAPLLFGSLEQSEPVVELAQGKPIPWTYSDGVLHGVRANCKRRCGYRRAICKLEHKHPGGCVRSYSNCLSRCETPGGPPLYPPPGLAPGRR
jgi:hypothetical protein